MIKIFKMCYNTYITKKIGVINMDYKKIVIAGGGILGSQIAFQSAYCGYDVTILVRKEDAKRSVRAKLDKLRDTYIETIELMKKGVIVRDCTSFKGIDEYWIRISIATLEEDKRKLFFVGRLPNKYHMNL